ncbi:MAG: phosphoribosylglycinamide formyltransferase [Candidatus Eisenbacteria bacterium]
MSRIRIGVLASGRGSNLQAIIDSVKAGRLDAEVAVVVSDVEDAHALCRARSAGIEARYIDPARKGARLSKESERKVTEVLEEFRVDLIALAGFMRILRTDFVRHFSGRIMNIHPSLLPSFPGLKVQKKALEYGVKYSGCTVHFVDEGVDTGPIIIQAAVPVLEGDTEELLSNRIFKEEHRIYTEAMRLFAQGRLRIEGRVVRILPERRNDAGGDESRDQRA